VKTITDSTSITTGSPLNWVLFSTKQFSIMKTIRNIFALFLMAVFNACMDEYTEVFTANSPVYMSYEELREAVRMKVAPRDLKIPGKFILKTATFSLMRAERNSHHR
jgi:hypothetical protein